MKKTKENVPEENAKQPNQKVTPEGTLNRLIQKAKENQNTIDTTDILKAVQNNNEEFYEKICECLEKNNINISDDEEDSVEEKGKTESESEGTSSESIKIYLKDISRFKLLTCEEEIELGKTIKESDSEELKEKACENLVKANLRLVVTIAKEYQGKNMSLMDLIQEGNMGLITAATKFDYRKGVRFVTYAQYFIKQKINRAIANQSRTIRLPVYFHDRLAILKGVEEQLTIELGREPNDLEIASEMNLPVTKIQEMREIKSTVSIETPVGEDGAKVEDFCYDNHVIGLEDYAVLSVELEKAFQNVMVTRQEEEVIRLLYGLNKERKSHTRKWIADKLGLTILRVSHIEQDAYAKLKPLCRHLNNNFKKDGQESARQNKKGR